MKHHRNCQRLLVCYTFCCYAAINQVWSMLPSQQRRGVISFPRNHLRSTLLYAQQSTTSTTDRPHENSSDHNSMESFLSQLQESIQENTFSSITLYGPSKAALKKITDTEQTRGCLIRITGRLIQSKENSKQSKTKHNTPLSPQFQVTYKYHLATDICKNWPLSNVPQSIRSLLIWTTAHSDNDLDPSILVPSEWGTPQQQSHFGLHTATLDTTTTRYQLDLRTNTLSRHAITSTTATPQPHDRSKAVPLSSEAPMWQALGILNEQGKPRANMASKYKQCQTFVQLLAQRIPFLASETTTTKKKITVTDMGCGRGYLTFALHHYLSEQQKGSDLFTVYTVGYDVRPKLVQEIQIIADSLGSPFDTLQFVTSTIEEYTQQRTAIERTTQTDEHTEDYQILIALHACDTATDDALWAGIQQEMDLLVVAPCCHRQVRPQLDAYHASSPNHALADLWQYNIYRERHAESITDTLRALLLEWAGYQVQVFEFIGGEHTSKNVMITAVRDNKRGRNEGKLLVEQRIQSLASFHGIDHQALAQHLGVALMPGKEANAMDVVKKRSKYGLPQ